MDLTQIRFAVGPQPPTARHAPGRGPFFFPVGFKGETIEVVKVKVISNISYRFVDLLKWNGMNGKFNQN